ncbi:MAG: type II toxin-antitoxin system RelE/ParE family toxin, partial [Gemmatimonadetes bacterium]|nr:type II toxin-antitoxin system RelE/ParE family toxin [Gemmatimonadota bacterium]
TCAEHGALKPAILSAHAEEDVADILSFYQREYSHDAAESLQHSLYAAFQLLAKAPHIGRARPEIEDGLRSFVVSNYLILYHDFESYVYVTRVLHQRRELRRAYRKKRKR